jgi:hypothetical protein
MNGKEQIDLLQMVGDNLTSRVLGIDVRKEALKILETEPYVIFNFSGVKSISTGFAYEVFSYLYEEYQDKFNVVIKIKLDSINGDIIKKVILKSLKS